MAPFTTFGIGGPSRYFTQAKKPQALAAAFQAARELGIRCFILGGGSNILFADEGFNGLVIKDECREFTVQGNSITAQSGAWLDGLVDAATEHSLTGFEFAAGIPGTVGGAIYGNAGAFGGCIADILESAVVCDAESKPKVVGPGYFEFAYRSSRLKTNFEVVLSASFKLGPGEKSRIAERASEHRQLRRIKHPTEEGCAGSVFKNIKKPSLLPAGKLLEEAGARGLMVGGAAVYEKHCNIIVNKRGDARAKEVMELADLLKQMALDKLKIKLEYELILIEP